jgi:hypothetical protein
MKLGEMLKTPRVVELSTRQYKLGGCIDELVKLEEQYATANAVDRCAGRLVKPAHEAAVQNLQATIKFMNLQYDAVKWDLDRLLEDAE